MAAFLKSVSFDMGQVTSRHTLLMNTASSKNGTKVVALRRPVAPLGLHHGLDLAAARFDPGDIIALQATFLGIVRVHEDHGRRHGTVQLRYPARHGAGVPVFQHAAGGQPQVVVVIRLLRWRRIGPEEDLGLAGQAGLLLVGDLVQVAAGQCLECLAVEVEAAAFRAIGVVLAR